MAKRKPRLSEVVEPVASEGSSSEVGELLAAFRYVSRTTPEMDFTEQQKMVRSLKDESLDKFLKQWESLEKDHRKEQAEKLAMQKQREEAERKKQVVLLDDLSQDRLEELIESILEEVK